MESQPTAPSAGPRPPSPATPSCWGPTEPSPRSSSRGGGAVEIVPITSFSGFDFDELKVGDRIVIDCLQYSGVELLNFELTVIHKTSEQATGCAHGIFYEMSEPWWYPIHSATMTFSPLRLSGEYYNSERGQEMAWGISESALTGYPEFDGLWYRFG